MNQNTTRPDLLVALKSLAVAIPEMRVGQLMAAAGELCVDLHGRGLWEASDEELFEAILQFQRDFEATKVDGSLTVRPASPAE